MTAPVSVNSQIHAIKMPHSLLKSYTNPYYTVYFLSYYQYFLRALTPAPTFTLKLLVIIIIIIIMIIMIMMMMMMMMIIMMSSKILSLLECDGI